MKIRLLFLGFVLLFLYGCAGIDYLTDFSGCIAARQGIKRGDEAVTKGDNYAAANEYLDVLAKKPKHKKALAKLSGIAKIAYEQKLKIAKGYIDQKNLEDALTEYKQLSRFIDRLKTYNALDFVPIDVDKVIKEVSVDVAEKYYIMAESLFSKAQYEEAIREYESALNFTRSYKDANEKIAESFYNIALNCEQAKHYRLSAENYQKSLQRVRGYKDATQRATTLYYSLGSYFLSTGQCRKAYEDLSQAKGIIPQYKDIDNKLAAAKDGATTKIAFVRFENTTEKDLAGMSLGDFISETIKTKVQSGASQFIQMLDREQLLVLAQEQRISEGILSSESTVSIKLEGVHYFIFGKINQVREVYYGLSKTPTSAEYEYSYGVPYTDEKGKQKTRTERAKATMHYSLCKNKLSVTIGGSIRVVEAKTGKVVINHQILEERNDEIIYADEFRAPHNLTANNVSFSDNIKKVTVARRELKDVDILAKDIIDSISSATASKILSFLDVTPSVSDPTLLTIEHTADKN